MCNLCNVTNIGGTGLDLTRNSIPQVSHLPGTYYLADDSNPPPIESEGIQLDSFHLISNLIGSYKPNLYPLLSRNHNPILQYRILLAPRIEIVDSFKTLQDPHNCIRNLHGGEVLSDTNPRAT